MIEITEEPIDYERVLSRVRTPHSGALVTFDGRVRDHSQGKAVRRLYYEAYRPMALRELEQLVVSAQQKWPIDRVGIVHRVGRLEIEESSVFIAVSAAHRKDAFEACRWLIDTLKEQVPIWKKEYFEDGEVWVDPRP